MNDTPPQLRIAQIIVLALVSGVVTFAVIAMQIAPAGNATANLNQLRIVGAVLLGACLTAAIAVKWVMGARRRASGQNPYAYDPAADRPADPEAAARFFVMTILGCALAEGVALYGVVVYMMSGQPVDLLTVGLPLAVMVGVFFPTRGRWERYVGR